mmetsp:Transcript_6968/g.16631  ORF Transcript_6968/g.16631 Transcript_6968/m.16631 type:complete len:226 (+) Transcript_6968:667-1344(+)
MPSLKSDRSQNSMAFTALGCSRELQSRSSLLTRRRCGSSTSFRIRPVPVLYGQLSECRRIPLPLFRMCSSSVRLTLMIRQTFCIPRVFTVSRLSWDGGMQATESWTSLRCTRMANMHTNSTVGGDLMVSTKYFLRLCNWRQTTWNGEFPSLSLLLPSPTRSYRSPTSRRQCGATMRAPNTARQGNHLASTLRGGLGALPITFQEATLQHFATLANKIMQETGKGQ